ERAAGLGGDRLGDSGSARFEQVGRFPEDGAPLRRWRLRPFLKSSSRSADGGDRVERPGIGHPRNQLTGEGIPFFIIPAIAGCGVAAADTHRYIHHWGLPPARTVTLGGRPVDPNPLARLPEFIGSPHVLRKGWIVGATVLLAPEDHG